MTKSLSVKGNAASEIEMRLEVAEVGDADWGLLAQWTGKAILVFDAAHADRLAGLACDLANGLDVDLMERLVPVDDRNATRGACIGLWNLSTRLRTWAAK